MKACSFFIKLKNMHKCIICVLTLLLLNQLYYQLTYKFFKWLNWFLTINPITHDPDHQTSLTNYLSNQACWKSFFCVLLAQGIINFIQVDEGGPPLDKKRRFQRTRHIPLQHYHHPPLTILIELFSLENKKWFPFLKIPFSRIILYGPVGSGRSKKTKKGK